MRQFYPKNGRVILHVDMNSFFASVEMASDPTLKGKPLAIAGDASKRRGIVVTSSYEARKYGVKTTMPVWEARKLCPDLIVREPNFEKYRAASQAMFSLLNQFTSLVEPVSIDEGYLDITDCKDLGSPIKIAKMIQTTILNELDLPCSIGIAPNKFLAKMASDMKKPLGISVLRKRDVPKIIWPLPVIEMHGVGQKTADKLSQLNIYTIEDLAKANEVQLKGILGIRGQQLKERANGVDLRPVDPEAAQEHKSVSSSTTLPEDLSNQTELFQILKKLAQSVSDRMRNKGYVAMNISITIRYKNRRNVTRGKKLNNPIKNSDEIFMAAKMLFTENWTGEPVRLLGITGQDLVHEEEAVEQLDLFTYAKVAQKEPLFQVIDQIQKRYGKTGLTKARDLKNKGNKR